MYKEDLNEEILKSLFKKLIKLFNLTKWDLSIHYIHSKAKILEKEFGRKAKDEMALTIFKKKSHKAVIIIYYNLHKKLYDVISSMIHELLHVKFRPLKAKYKDEELVVQDLEKALAVLIHKYTKS